jgi:methylated-DNA-[protein]-cysteine S-methyltransferase
MIRWAYAEHEEWRLVVAATTEGLAFIGSQGKDFEELEAWARFHFGKAYELIRDDAAMEAFVVELRQYWNGERSAFTVPLDLRGTAFQQAVWRAMAGIPYGETATYTEIAERIGKPKAVRAVGAAIGRNPALIFAPCHRIVGKDGSLTGFRGGLAMKQSLLKLERQHAALFLG